MAAEDTGYLTLVAPTAFIALSKFVGMSDFPDDRDRTLKNPNTVHEANKKMYDRNKLECSFCVYEKIYIENGNKLNRN